MADWKNEAQAREQIKALVAEYYHDFKEKKEPFHPGDRIAYAFVHNSEGEVILISELGYMKRCLLIDFERQARGGKGVRSFGFLKNGSNGTRIAGALMVRDPFDFRIVQKSGAVTKFNSEEVSIETKAGKGTPYVVVVMDDVVVELQN